MSDDRDPLWQELREMAQRDKAIDIHWLAQRLLLLMNARDLDTVEVFLTAGILLARYHKKTPDQLLEFFKHLTQLLYDRQILIIELPMPDDDDEK
jgi:hypothetical protein